MLRRSILSSLETGSIGGSEITQITDPEDSFGTQEASRSPDPKSPRSSGRGLEELRERRQRLKNQHIDRKDIAYIDKSVNRKDRFVSAKERLESRRIRPELAHEPLLYRRPGFSAPVHLRNVAETARAMAKASNFVKSIAITAAETRKKEKEREQRMKEEKEREKKAKEKKRREQMTRMKSKLALINNKPKARRNSSEGLTENVLKRAAELQEIEDGEEEVKEESELHEDNETDTSDYSGRSDEEKYVDETVEIVDDEIEALSDTSLGRQAWSWIEEELAMDPGVVEDIEPPPPPPNDQDVYRKMCKENGITASNPFIKSLAKEESNQNWYGHGPVGAKCIAESLKLNFCVKKLYLHDNALEDGGTMAIVDLLNENSTLEVLRVSKNRISKRAGIQLFAACHGLVELDVSENMFDDDCVREFMKHIGISSLRKINFSKNKISNTSCEMFANVFANNLSGLEDIDLSWNHIRSRGSVVVFHSLFHNIVVKKLNLAWNSLSQEGGVAMGDMIAVNRHLEYLNVSHTRVDGNAGLAISQGVMDNTTLKGLYLDDNPLGNKGCTAIMNALNVNDVLEDVGLKNTEGGSTEVQTTVSFDRSDPDGFYVLDLSNPWETWISKQLLKLAFNTEPGGYFAESSLDGKHFKIREDTEMPKRGLLQFNYCRHKGEVKPTQVHYILDLSSPHDISIAQHLLDKARDEPGENWINETLNGEPFDLNEDDPHFQLPQEGVLEFDYLTTNDDFEKHYVLNLADPADRAVAQKLRERAIVEEGEQWRNETLDGEKFVFSEDPSWKLPKEGILELDFYTSQPQHMDTIFYSFDLSKPEDWSAAEQLRIRAVKEPGQNWFGETLNGKRFEFKENVQDVLPKYGVLEFMYVTTQVLNTSLYDYKQHYELDMSEKRAKAIVEHLVMRAFTNPNESFIETFRDGNPVDIPKGEKFAVPLSGIFVFDYQTKTDKLAINSQDFNILISQIENSKSDPDKIIIVKNMHTGTWLRCDQVVEVVSKFKFVDKRLGALLYLSNRVVDPANFYSVFMDFMPTSSKEMQGVTVDSAAGM